MNYLNVKDFLKNECGATKMYCKVNYKPYKIMADLYFTISEEGIKKIKENENYIENSMKDFSCNINKFNRVHIACTL